MMAITTSSSTSVKPSRDLLAARLDRYVASRRLLNNHSKPVPVICRSHDRVRPTCAVPAKNGGNAARNKHERRPALERLQRPSPLPLPGVIAESRSPVDDSPGRSTVPGVSTSFCSGPPLRQST